MKQKTKDFLIFLSIILFLFISVGIIGCVFSKKTQTTDKCNCTDTLYVPTYVKVPVKTDNCDSLMQETIDELIYNNVELHKRVADCESRPIKIKYKNIKIKDSQLQSIQVKEMQKLTANLNNQIEKNSKLKQIIKDKSKDKSKVKTDNSETTKTGSGVFIFWVVIFILICTNIYVLYRYLKCRKKN